MTPRGYGISATSQIRTAGLNGHALTKPTWYAKVLRVLVGTVPELSLERKRLWPNQSSRGCTSTTRFMNWLGDVDLTASLGDGLLGLTDFLRLYPPGRIAALRVAMCLR